MQKAGLTGEEYEYSTKMKKLYSEQDGIKAIEKQTFNPHTDEWETSFKTIIQDGNIAQTIGELQRVAQKQNDGTWKVTRQEIRDIHGRGYAIDTIDAKSGEVASTKVAGTYKEYEKDNGGLLRKTVEEVDNAGNKVVNNYRNGRLYSTTKITIQPDGTKRIVVEYSKIVNKKGQTIIDVAKDGTRKVVQEAKEDLIRM